MYAAETDPYCYPRTNVLKNRLDLRDADALEAFEADAVTQRGDEPLPDGDFSPASFRNLHHHLFQDVYDWAGKYRTVRIGKGSSMFCYPEYINGQMEALFEWLAEQKFLRRLDADVFAAKGAHFLSELNVIHPFRDGNGRTQMVFFGILAVRAEYHLDLEQLRPEVFLAAMIAAFNGDEAPLAAQIRQLI